MRTGTDKISASGDTAWGCVPLSLCGVTPFQALPGRGTLNPHVCTRLIHMILLCGGFRSGLVSFYLVTSFTLRGQKCHPIQGTYFVSKYFAHVELFHIQRFNVPLFLLRAFVQFYSNVTKHCNVTWIIIPWRVEPFSKPKGRKF